MSDHTFILGGGLGGLSAGAYLAGSGIPVTLIEEQPHVGGYAIAFKRDSFIFDVALHAIPAGEPGQPFHKLITQLGIANEVEFLRLKDAFFVQLGNDQFQIPNNYSEFFKKLKIEFPAEADGLRKLDRFLTANAPVFFNVINGDAEFSEITGKFILKIPRFLRLSNTSTVAFLQQYIRSPKVRALLYQAAVFFGQPMSEFPAINFIIMFYLLFTTGMFTIRGGGQALTNALEKKIREHGGTIITGKRVTKITLQNNKAKVLYLDDGSVLNTHALISNINTSSLVNEILGAENFSAGYLESLDTLSPSISILQLHLGLDCPVQKLGIEQHIRIIFPDEDLDAAISRQNDSPDIEGFSILAPGITDPNPGSKNEQILSIVGGVSAKKWLELNDADYKMMKTQITTSMIEKLDKQIPGIRKHIKTIDLATPRTFRRYTRNPDGAILGYKTLPGMHRTLLKISKFPVQNIFLASAWTSNLGGFMQCIKSGIEAGTKVRRYLKKL